MQKLYSHQALITKPSLELLDLAVFLDIPVDIDFEDDHVFIVDSVKGFGITSFLTRRAADVLVPNEVFFEVLMDIKGGMTVLEAYEKQGYTY